MMTSIISSRYVPFVTRRFIEPVNCRFGILEVAAWMAGNHGHLRGLIEEYLVDRIRATQQIVFAIRVAVADLERNLIAERVKAGQ